MAKIKIETTQNVVINFKLADTGDRIIAKLIDIIILAIYYIAIMSTLGSVLAIDKGVPEELKNAIFWFIFVIVFLVCPYVFYTPVCELFMNGQTFGKKAMKLRVIKVEGSGVTIGDCIMRWLFQPLDYFFGYCVAVVSITISKKAQRLGDIAAGTTVIKLKKQVSLKDTVLRSLDKRYQIRFSNVLELSDRDINTIREAIALYKKTKDDKYIKILAQKVRDILNIEIKMKPFVLLETVLKDYNALALQQNNE